MIIGAFSTTASPSFAASEAERLYHRALEQDRNNVAAIVGLYDLHFDRAEFRDALGYAKRALALQRQHGSSFDFWRSKSVLDRFNPKARELLNDVGLSEFANTPAVEMPYGRKRALEIATTLALDPEMMLLDEPMAGMGHEDIDKVAALIKRISQKYTILMVEHNLNVVANLSDTITVLTRGQVLAEGNYATVSKHPQVKEAYLGAGHE